LDVKQEIMINMKYRLIIFIGALVVMILAAGLLFSNNEGTVAVIDGSSTSYLHK